MSNRVAIPALFLLIITVFPIGANPALNTYTPRTTTINTVTPAGTSPTFLGPIAAFTYNPCVMCAVPGALVFFDASPSRTTASAITLYTWNFGDKTPVQNTTNPTINHDYFGYPNKWIVTLTVTDNMKHSDSITQLVMFLVHPLFTYHPTIPAVNQPAVFNATASISYNSTSPIQTYQWSFGDGTTGTGKLALHAYAAQGQYRVTLQLTTRDGNPQVSQTITVANIVSDNFFFTDTFDKINITASGNLNYNTTTRTLSASLVVTATNTTTGEILYTKNIDFTTTFQAGMGNPRFILGISLGTITLALGCKIDQTTSSTSCILTRNPDQDNDGRVDLIDVALLVFDYGSIPGSTHWDPNADLAGNNQIDLTDVSISVADFGTIVYS